MNNMRCTECPYYWADTEEVLVKDEFGNILDTYLEEVDGVQYCHYTWNDGYAPCEV